MQAISCHRRGGVGRTVVPHRAATAGIIAALAAALAVPAGLALAPVPATAQAAPHYHVVRRAKPGGEGFWDYMTADPAGHRLFVSHGTHVQVVDLHSLRVVGDIPNTPGVHGIALAPELERGFTSNGRDTSVTIFDLKTLKPIGTVKVTGRNPDAILYDPATRRVFTFNHHEDGNATAIDAATGRVVGTIALHGTPEFAQSDAAGRVFVNIEDSSAVVAINARTLAVEARWPLAPCQHPTGMAIDRQHGRLFVGCGNHVMAVMDTHTGKVLSAVPVGAGVDATRYDPGTGLAFSSNGRDGTLSVVHEASPGHWAVLETVPTQLGARTMALDTETHHVYVVTASFEPRPAGTPQNRRRRPRTVPGSFVLLELAP